MRVDLVGVERLALEQRLREPLEHVAVLAETAGAPRREPSMMKRRTSSSIWLAIVSE